jgi:hypothetical protein
VPVKFPLGTLNFIAFIVSAVGCTPPPKKDINAVGWLEKV